jgi:GTP-binding protein
MVLTVPVGTVVRELKREGEDAKIWEEEEELELDKEERRRRRWERVFVSHPSAAVEEGDYKEAETMLRKERRFANVTPTFEEDTPVVHDLEKIIDEPILLARGGQGGLGNPFFASVSGHRAPRIASRGLQPYASTFELELKLLADVGLVGFPNAGKSTLLRGLTGRRAEVAGYEFTTLNPQIGVVRVWDDGSWGGGGVAALGGQQGEGVVVEESWRERERDEAARERGEYAPLPRSPRGLEKEKIEVNRFTISDNPGLLPQASENVGLGHSFLRSIERSLALCYVLDLTRPNPASDLHVLRGELEAYKCGLSRKGAVVVLNKGDEVDEIVGRERWEGVKEVAEEMGVMVLSGKYGLGLERLVRVLGERVEEARKEDLGQPFGMRR